MAGALVAGLLYALIFAVSEDATKASADISDYIIERPPGLEAKNQNKYAYGEHNDGYANTNI